MTTQRQNYALIFAYVFGVLCGLLLAMWWRLAQIKQNEEFVGQMPLTHTTERN